MKKSLILALALAAPVFAGDSKGITIPVIKADAIPATETTEAIVAPVAAPAAFSLEIGTSYFEMKDDNGYKLDWNGLDITGVYHITPNWSVTLRGAYGIGDDSVTYVDEPYIDHYDEDFSDWYIAPGIRYTVGLTESITWYIGANIGYGKSNFKSTWSWEEYVNGTPIPGESETEKDNTYSWFYSAETGVQWHCTETVYIYAALQYALFKPPSNEWYDQKCSGAKIGVGFDF